MPGPQYWRFRLHVRLEDLLANDAWLGDIKQLVGPVNDACHVIHYLLEPRFLS